MKLIIIVALIAFAAARPQELEKKPNPVAILREESDPIDGANFRHEFEADNGLIQSMVGSADENGAQVISGSYSFPLPDGSIATFDWVADAAGFRVESPLLPVVDTDSLPLHVQGQIYYAEAQQEKGLVWDQAAESWV